MAAASGAAAPPKSGFKGTLVEILLVTIIAGAIGLAFAIARPAAPQRAAETEDKASPRQVSNVIDLPPIVSNLASPTDTWVRMEISIVFDGASVDHPEVEAAQIGGDALAYMRTVTLAQIEGSVGLQNVRQDLNERARIRSNGRVKELIIRTLVVQ